jgi:hypothetical protein
LLFDVNTSQLRVISLLKWAHEARKIMIHVGVIINFKAKKTLSLKTRRRHFTMGENWREKNCVGEWTRVSALLQPVVVVVIFLHAIFQLYFSAKKFCIPKRLSRQFFFAFNFSTFSFFHDDVEFKERENNLVIKKRKLVYGFFRFFRPKTFWNNKRNRWTLSSSSNFTFHSLESCLHSWLASSSSYVCFSFSTGNRKPYPLACAPSHQDIFQIQNIHSCQEIFFFARFHLPCN